jgi:PAS domain S-box-containing protein
MPINFLGAVLNQKLLDRFPTGVYLCNAEGLIVYFNDHAVQMWGRAPTLNEPMDRFCGSVRLYHSDGRIMPHNECWMALALKTGQEYNGAEVIVERPDGTRRTGLAHVSPFFDDAGKLEGAINIVVDISDRKEAERAKAFLGAIVESSEDAIIRKSLDGVIQSWNVGAERLFGYSAVEAIGESIMIIIPPELIHEERLILSRLCKGERIEHFETTRVTKDGKRIEISLSISPVRDGTGQIVGASKIARDITARKQGEAVLIALKDELQDADLRKNEFLATLAHELRNPLAVVCNSLQRLALDDSLNSTADQVREIMDQQCKQMIRLVDDLLDASRISRGQIELRREVIELASVVHDAVQASRSYIDKAKHQLAITLPAEPVVLNADPIRLGQVLGNLLCNAAKYTPPGGQIWLSAQVTNDGVRLSVRDTGIGIRADVLPQIFDMFMQVGSSKGGAIGGLGVGLALARKLVELHDGRIEVLSEGEDQGTEFVVWLPTSCLRKQSRATNSREARKVDSTPFPLRILVVDDNYAVVVALRLLLEKLGHEVETAADAMAAIEAVIRSKPDVVFSDIAMPGINGYELARRLKQMPEMAGVLLVALTGYGQDTDRLASDVAGFDRHVVKPIGLQALQDILNEQDSLKINS